MQLINRTGLPARLYRGEVEPELMLATVVVKLVAPILDSGELGPPDDIAKIEPLDSETPLGILPGEQVPYKLGVDVFVLGNAHAPGGKPTGSTEVALRVGDWERRLLIFGDRVWQRAGDELRPTEPAQFTHMPVTYANAYGGVAEVAEGQVPCPENPAGKGYVLSEELAVGQPLPNIEAPERPIRTWRDQPLPAGLAPYAKQTKVHVDRGVQIVDAETLAWKLLPGFFSSAHPELVLPEVKAGDKIVVTGMTPEGVLCFRVPELAVTARVQLGEKRVELPLRLDTIGVLAEERRATFTLRTSFRYDFVREQTREVLLETSEL